jgi:RNA polymerase sigma factor (sigma-70 family)
MGRDIICGISIGDRKIFLAFYQQVSIPLLKFIYFRAGGDMNLAEDVFQTTFERMIQAKESLVRLQDDEMLFPWLCGVAKRVLADHFREHTSKRYISLDRLDITVQEALLQIETRQIPTDTSAHPQMQMLIGMVMSSLKTSHAETLKAKYCEGLSVQEIAEKFGETAKTIEGRLFRAREAFREAFQKIRKELEANNA